MSDDNDGLKLRILRETLGITQNEVALSIGVSPASVGRFERNSDTLKDEDVHDKILAFMLAYPENRIDEFFDEKMRKAKERQERKAKELAELRAKMKHSFTEGQSYFIFDSGNAKTDSDDFESNDMKPETGKGCIFVYLRKEGRHHIFREKRGGWIRTYTDTQLMGKKIKKVKS